jgi:hypothetical protein
MGKKVRGRPCDFGTDPDAALNMWLAVRDDLYAGRTPRLHPEGATVRDAVNWFLSSKKVLLEAGELSARTWRDYYATCETLVDVFGKSQDKP